FYVEYSNTGSQAMPAPLLVLGSSRPDDLPFFTLDPSLRVSGFWTSALPAGYSHTVEILASGKVPGVLEPGESFTVPVYYAGMQRPWNFNESTFQFNLQVYTQKDQATVDWGGLASSLQPAGLSSAAWGAVYAGLTADLGNTWGDYVRMLDNNARYLGKLGENVNDVAQLWQFAILQADGLSPAPVLSSSTDLSVPSAGIPLDFTRTFGASVVARNLSGPFGYGWTDNWQYSLTSAADGTVTVIMPSGLTRVFQPDSRGTDYFDQAGDHGVLSLLADGTYQLLETNGTIEHFNANGTLDYVQDANGNRVTAGYTSGQLTSLTSSSGGSIAIGYNSAGLISTLTSSDGRVVQYSYDAANQHLSSVLSYDGGTTSYSYVAGTNAAVANALARVVNPGGDSVEFAYQTDGLLASTSRDGGGDRVVFAYNQGEVSATNAGGGTSYYFYNEQGRLLKYVDPLGNASYASYDASGNLVGLTGPTGLTATYTYNAAGLPTSATNALGQTTTFTYVAGGNELASVTGPTGQTTNFAYDAHGNQTSVQYPDQSVTSTTY
ncbi:MAG: RHS repeat protein, partial [Planctomycetota bacterium]|nr:RHS repeat protein [Planctomycetota bacterium]